MNTFTVTVTLDAPSVGLHRAAELKVPIPPDYNPADVIQLYAVTLEQAVEQLVRAEGWRSPLRHALHANDARAGEIERRAQLQPTVSSAEILEILNTPSEQAIAQWGSGPVDL